MTDYHQLDQLFKESEHERELRRRAWQIRDLEREVRRQQTYAAIFAFAAIFLAVLLMVSLAAIRDERGHAALMSDPAMVAAMRNR